MELPARSTVSQAQHAAAQPAQSALAHAQQACHGWRVQVAMRRRELERVVQPPHDARQVLVLSAAAIRQAAQLCGCIAWRLMQGWTAQMAPLTQEPVPAGHPVAPTRPCTCTNTQPHPSAAGAAQPQSLEAGAQRAGRRGPGLRWADGEGLAISSQEQQVNIAQHQAATTAR